jgi:cyclic pyranopterin phosphate synthase
MMLRDALQRPVKDLRISVTDRCNYRCTYCMPLDEYVWIQRDQILTYEEIARLARLFVGLGVDKIRITGGEPLVRKNLDHLVSHLAGIAGVKDLCLTTNAALLAAQAEALRAAGLRRLNVSVDTLDPEKFRRITQRGDLREVLDGLFVAQRLGFEPIKLNAVIERGVNEDDILPLAEFAREHGFAIRYIEYMDVGNVNHWHSDKLVSKAEILKIIASRYELREIGRSDGTAPAVDYEFADGGGDLGVIASVTEPFCSSCTRARLTADGKLVTCLFSSAGHDLKALLRSGASDDEVQDFVRSVWNQRTDRYSDERLEAMQSGRSYAGAARHKIEMITLGG